MLKKSLSFTLSLLVDLVNAHLLIPGRDGKVFTSRGESKIGNTVFRRGIESDILGDITSRIGLGC